MTDMFLQALSPSNPLHTARLRPAAPAPDKADPRALPPRAPGALPRVFRPLRDHYRSADSALHTLSRYVLT